MPKPASTQGRWSLYRLLADPARLRLLALTAEQELSIGELADLLDESQPNVSRHASNLRQGDLVIDRRQGTRTFVRLVESARQDPVVGDAIREGRRLCLTEGRLERISGIVRKRDERAREYFEQAQRDQGDLRLASELPVYMLAVASVDVERELAVDAGTGDGAMLDVLAPFFRRVLAVDRSRAQLQRAEERILRRGYENVELMCGEVDDSDLLRLVREGANAVFATRLLHHVASPRQTMGALSALLRPGGELVVADYKAHNDAAFRDRGADVWMGFSKEELLGLTHAAGLVQAAWFDVPSGFVGGGVDGHVPWQLMRAMRPRAP
jgi:DNA-binding transcriptional ArsR family regulator